MSRTQLIPLLLAGAMVAGGGAAAATIGVSIDVGRIDVTEELTPGSEYRLPTFGVRNPGSEQTSYRMVVSHIDDQDALRPPEVWFTFSPPRVSLDGGASGAVSTRLLLPPDAEPGVYAALIGPQIAVEGEGAQVGAGAAARLTFTVAPSSWLDAWIRWITRFLAEHPWIWISALLVLLLIAIGVLRRRFALTVVRRT